EGVELPEWLEPGGWLRTLCPFCGGDHGREQQSFNLIVGDDYRFVHYKCWRANHCGVERTVYAEEWRPRGRAQQQPPRPQVQPEGGREELDADCLAYFAQLGISAATLRAAGVFLARDVPHPLDPRVTLERVVAYPYYNYTYRRRRRRRGGGSDGGGGGLQEGGEQEDEEDEEEGEGEEDDQPVNVTYHDIFGYCLSSLPSTSDTPDDPSPSSTSEQHLDYPPHLQPQSSQPAQQQPPPPHPPHPHPGLQSRPRWQPAGCERLLWGLH
ncbi:hypothetical protein Agub_g8510, partial [Astrephomene gubernaculifera]